MSEVKSSSRAERFVGFMESVKWKRISSLLDGFVSGLCLGIVFTILIFATELDFPIPPNVVTLLIVPVVIGVAAFIWGVHSALTTKAVG